MIGGLEAVSEGQIVIDGKDATDRPPSERSIAMVLSYALYPQMTVRDNMAFPLKIGTMLVNAHPRGIDHHYVAGLTF
ncbi:ABC transporter ATP-binding protein [Rhizobium leguminosarum]|nr:ABC transporter ATP-binding protein [Rhizobium leguminosarum]MBY2975426.1 ABC transporter ATP-binding protein [Rhizobium leguminosarum]MBY2977668.1 ABC transporter ATP-binding protein [Rhizobium leguminosarum]MBY3006218.1 ABC transporter ATP-binding protein [Rhizobium leguminosarum]